MSLLRSQQIEILSILGERRKLFLRSQIDTKAHYLDTFYDAFIHSIRQCVEWIDGREHKALLSYVVVLMLRMCLAFN